MENPLGSGSLLPRLLLAAVCLTGCGVPERDNPLDPAAAHQGGPSSALVLQIPLPKELAGVVHRVVATLEAPGRSPIRRELSVSPLGPAYGTLSVLEPGPDRTLTLEGYDVAGHLIFTGQRTGITIVARQTTQVEIDLELVTQPPDTLAQTGQPGRYGASSDGERSTAVPADSAGTGGRMPAR